MIKNLKNKKKGFTLIELIIVIAIIAILAAVAIPKFGEVRKNASLKTDIANAKTIANAATALIAEENLVDGTYFVKQGEINAIANYLQNPPSPESKAYKNGVYEVIVSSGSVVVKMDTKTDGTGTETNLFPNPAASAQ